MKDTYVVNHSGITVSTAITIIQIKAGAAKGLEIMRAHVTQSTVTASTMARIQLLRKTLAATVTSFTPLKLDPDAVAAAAVGGTAATGITATVEGTDGDILHTAAFNMVSGWLYSPIPEERIIVPAGGIIALKFPAAPTSATWDAQIKFRELG